jgi:hypothetical protein
MPDKSCLSCESQHICRAYDTIATAVESRHYRAVFNNTSIIPGVHGKIYRATASDCSYYKEEK